MTDSLKPVLWDALSALDGYQCCWTNKRTGEACQKRAVFAERKLQRITTREFKPLDRTGRAYCKLHWGKRNAE